MFRERLKIAVRYVSAVTPRCLRCLIFMLSGPVELFSACLIASEVCSIVICMGVDFSLLVNLSMILYLRCELCYTWFMDCSLKCSAFCLSLIAVLLSKVMVMLGVCGCFLCARPFKFSKVCDSSLCGPSCLSGVVSEVLDCGFVFLCLCLRFVVLEVGLWGFVVLLCCAVSSCFLCVLAVVFVCGVFSFPVCGVCLRRV